MKSPKTRKSVKKSQERFLNPDQVALFPEAPHVDPIELPLKGLDVSAGYAPQSDWRPPEISSLPDWGSARRIGIDVETRDDKLKDLGIGVRRGGYVVGFSITIEDGPSMYLPIRHQGGDNLPEDEVLRYMRENAKRFTGSYVGANLSYDLDYLWQEGIVSREASYKDVQVADPLLYELHRSYSLEAIGNRHGFGGKDEGLLQQAAKAFGVHPKSGIWRLPARYVGPYAEMDTVLPLKILRRQERMIGERGLDEVWQLECDVLPVLVKIRRRGIRIDQDKLAEIEKWSLREEALALETVFRETGHRIGIGDVHRAASFAPALKHIGADTTKAVLNEKGDEIGRKTSVDALLLKSVKHPVAQALLRARKVNKLRTTFAQSIRDYMVDGRIHCTYNQVVRQSEFGKDDDTEGGRFGRLSCKDPNLQQQPSRDEFASMWRSIYVPEEGAIWGCLDYSQQEPRWTTHFAALMNLERAQEAADEYWNNPKADNHDMMAKLTGLPRKSAKTIYLGLCYGQGGAKLCVDLGLPTEYAVGYKEGRDFKISYFDNREEAQRAIDTMPPAANTRGWPCAGPEGRNILTQFDEKAPFIKQLSKIAAKKAAKYGIIKSVSGRQMNFPSVDGKYEWTHKALNRLIQGSAADQTKRAMVLIDRENPETFIQLQVHDEMDGSFGAVSEAKRVAEIMRDAWPDTKVPFRVDVEIGSSWGDLKEAE